MPAGPAASHEPAVPGGARLPPSHPNQDANQARREPRPTGFMATGQVHEEQGTSHEPERGRPRPRHSRFMVTRHGRQVRGLPKRGVFRLSAAHMQGIALLFAGQGSQVVGMGRDFVTQSATAREWFARAQAVLGYDLGALCFEGPEDELTQTEHAQPAIFLVSWVAFQLLRERLPQLTVQAMAGLSLGEFTALAAAGALGFEDGLRLVRQRGRFMQEACEASRGGMAAVLGLDEALTREVCAETGVSLANLNCPGQLVISGEADRVQRACELAQAKGARRALPLPVAGAYHSPLMAPAQPRLAAELAAAAIQPPAVPVVSNVTAQPHGDPASIRQRLVEQVTAPVRWEQSMRHLLAQGVNRFIELGPGTALTGFMKRIEKSAVALNVADGPSLEATVRALA